MTTPKKINDHPEVHFNLDTLERENEREPYAFVLGGRRWTTLDPQEMDWQDLAALDVRDFGDNFRVLLGAEAYAEFRQVKHVPQWKIERLNDAVMKHYGLINPGEADGSSTS